MPEDLFHYAVDLILDRGPFAGLGFGRQSKAQGQIAAPELGHPDRNGRLHFGVIAGAYVFCASPILRLAMIILNILRSKKYQDSQSYNQNDNPGDLFHITLRFLINYNNCQRIANYFSKIKNERSTKVKETIIAATITKTIRIFFGIHLIKN
jgi:hypothetical protein